MTKYAQKDLRDRMQLLQSRISKLSVYQRGGNPSRALPHLCLWHSVRVSSTQLSPYKYSFFKMVFCLK